MAAIARARTGYGALFRHPGYRRLWIANAISLIGDAITRIALPVYVYRLTGSAAALGGTVVLQSFAASVIGLTCGVFVDRLSRKGILTLVPIVQAAIVALLPLTAALWQVLLITLIASGLAIFTGTARFAAIPDIVGPALMPYAAASGQISTQAMNVIGPSIGGLLVALVGVRTAFLLDAATFLAAAALVATVAIPRPSVSGAAIPLRADLLTGLRYIWSRPVVQFLVFGDLAGDVGYTTMLVLSVALVEGVLNHGSAIFGLLIAAHAAGYVASALIATRLANRPGRMRYWVVGGLAVAGAGLLVAALVPTLVGASSAGSCSARGRPRRGRSRASSGRGSFPPRYAAGRARSPMRRRASSNWRARVRLAVRPPPSAPARRSAARASCKSLPSARRSPYFGTAGTRCAMRNMVA
jgi:hypothetical protein